MSGLRAVAWDIDGTLVDSERLHHASLLAGSLAHGVDLSDVPEQTFRGIHMDDVWTALQPQMPASLRKAEWLDAITAHYIADRASLKPLPGAIATIEDLAARGIPQGCVSNSHRAIVAANLDMLGIAALLEFTIAFEDVAAGKPDPAPYAAAVRRFGLAPGDVLAVEDSRAGLESAAAAGLHVALCEPIPIPERWADRVTHVAAVADILARFGSTSRAS